MKPVETQSRTSRNRPAIALFLVGLLFVFAGAAAQARASYPVSSVLLQADQTPTEAGANASPTGQGSNVPTPGATAIAALTATAGAINPVGTGQPPAALPTGGAAAPGGNPPGASDVTPAPKPQSSGGDFPWLIVIGVILLALAGLGFAFLRPRGQTVAATGTAGTAPRGPRATGATTTTTTTQATTAPRAAAVATPVPATITCPNCGTVNTTDEKFCHECGQDLRPLIAQVTPVAPAAAAVPAAAGAVAGAGAGAPADIVEDDTPYLETMDRVDEQLEYVLSRPRIVIGSGAGNDIVIDSAFKGWQTVSPRHAELHKEQDGFVIVDRESQNGTFVNEMRTGENILSDGDLVRLGDVRFVFRVPQAGQ